MSHKELLLTNRFVYQESLLRDIIRLSEKNDILEYNIPPAILEDFSNSNLICQKLNLTLDFPFSQLDTYSRMNLLYIFDQTYQNLINSYNLGIVPSYIDKKKLSKDLGAMPFKDKIRIFIEWSMTKNNEELKEIIQIIKNEGYNHIIIGTNYKKIDLNEILTESMFQQDLNVSIFGNFTPLNKNPKIHSILYTPEDLFNLN